MNASLCVTNRLMQTELGLCDASHFVNTPHRSAPHLTARTSTSTSTNAKVELKDKRVQWAAPWCVRVYVAAVVRAEMHLSSGCHRTSCVFRWSFLVRDDVCASASEEQAGRIFHSTS